MVLTKQNPLMGRFIYISNDPLCMWRNHKLYDGCYDEPIQVAEIKEDALIDKDGNIIPISKND